MNGKYSKIFTSEFLISAFEQAENVNKLSKMLGVNNTTIIKYLNKYGIEYKKLNRYEVNRSFFSEINENSLYVAGFIAADGCISNGKIEFGLSRKDRSQLELIKNLMSSTHSIRDTEYIGRQQSCLAIGSKQLVQELEKFNIVPNKTFKYELPDWLFHHPNVNHFLRGYVDGDGCWRIYKNKNCKLLKASFGILGTKKFVESFLSILIKNCGISPNKTVIKYKNIYRLSFGGIHITKNIASFIYNDATIWLQRKYDLAHKAIELSNLYYRSAPTKEEILKLKEILGNQKAVAKHFEYSTGRISQILNYEKK